MASYEILGQETDIKVRLVKAKEEEVERLKNEYLSVKDKLALLLRDTRGTALPPALETVKKNLDRKMNEAYAKWQRASQELEIMQEAASAVQPVVKQKVPEALTVPAAVPAVVSETAEKPVEVQKAGIIGKGLPIILISGVVLISIYKIFLEKHPGEIT